MRIYYFVASISNTTIADQIAKQVWDAPRMLQDTFDKVLTLEASLQLADGVHLWRPSQVMQVSTVVPGQCRHE